MCQYNFSLKIQKKKKKKFHFPYQELYLIMKVNLFLTTLEGIDVLITEVFTV